LRVNTPLSQACIFKDLDCIAHSRQAAGLSKATESVTAEIKPGGDFRGVDHSLDPPAQ
jgi:hypothetical protein